MESGPYWQDKGTTYSKLHGRETRFYVIWKGTDGSSAQCSKITRFDNLFVSRLVTIRINGDSRRSDAIERSNSKCFENHSFEARIQTKINKSIVYVI